MFTKQSTMSDAERIRLEEITFWNFIEHLFKSNASPVKVYGFIETVCALSECKILILNDVINICMTNDRRYRPTRNELIYILSKSKLAVRTIIAETKITYRDYYKLVAEDMLPIAPKFTPEQYIEIIKFLDSLRNIVPERIV